MTRLRLVALSMAALLWLGCARFAFTLDRSVIGEGLVKEQSALLRSPRLSGQRAVMRMVNPEWDLMGRTFAVMALANRALAAPSEASEHLAAIDAMLALTLAEQRDHGSEHFLLPYAELGTYGDPARRSLFVEGELALMLAARQSVQREARYDAELSSRIDRIDDQMRRGPLLSGESYPDQCWTFDNTLALVALRIYDACYGTDHGGLIHSWVKSARHKLIDPDTGLLVSSFSYDGMQLDGPEGSSLWFVTHNLLLLDPAFARAQYALAKDHLARSALGFGWSREWAHEVQTADVDSGAILPGIELSAAASGLAFVGAGAFQDAPFEQALLRSLALGGFPEATDAGLRFATTNQVADAVIGYGLVQGPLWLKIGPPPASPEGGES